jgi:hypothetical protein
MRLWTLHPSHLDVKGLVALWREALLAKAIVLGRTKGYRHHPQLDRFLRARDPVAMVNSYLAGVLEEARRRGYRFDARKARGCRLARRVREHRGQLAYEWTHLLRKLRGRDPLAWRHARRLGGPTAHPMFTIVPGPIRTWERPRVAGRVTSSSASGTSRGRDERRASRPR